MANIPVNIPSGEPNWKRAVLRWIEQASEYFRSSQIVADNRTVFAQHTPCGILLSAQPETSGNTAAASGEEGQWIIEVEEKDATAGETKFEVYVRYPDSGRSVSNMWDCGYCDVGGTTVAVM